MPGKTTRSSNLELLRILCMLLIIGDHLTGQSGIADYTTLPSSFAFCLIGCGSRIACSVFVLIGGWFLCEQPYKTRRPLSLWLSLWLYTVPVTLLCKLAGLDVSWGALRWAAFPASTRQLWFISDYLLLLLCVPLLNRLLRGLSRPAHRGLLAVLAVPLIVYPTLFGENGAVSDTAWMFLYEYLLIAYLRRWPDNRLAHLLQHRAAALGLGLGLPLLNTILRAVLETRGLTDGKAFQYMAYYRTALGALPGLLAALALGILIYLVYRKFYTGVVYSRSFAVTLVGMCVLTCMVTLAISTNVVISLGMVGALSIVRFRTAVKDPLDLLYLFWSITTGITAGAGMYALGLVTAVVMIGMIYLFSHWQAKGRVYIAVIHYAGTEAGDNIVRALGRIKFVVKSKTMRGENTEMAVEVFCNDPNVEFADRVRAVEGVQDVTLIQYNGEYHG